MEDCVFCKIAARDMPSEIVAEDDEMVAFKDINPQAPVHVLVIPKGHIANSAAAGAEDEALLGRLIRTGCRVAADLGLGQTGFRLVLNNGRDAGEAVPHLHLHVLGGRTLGWPPG